jgi:hypothetical protein
MYPNFNLVKCTFVWLWGRVGGQHSKVTVAELCDGRASLGRGERGSGPVPCTSHDPVPPAREIRSQGHMGMSPPAVHAQCLERPSLPFRVLLRGRQASQEASLLRGNGGQEPVQESGRRVRGGWGDRGQSSSLRSLKCKMLPEVERGSDGHRAGPALLICRAQVRAPKGHSSHCIPAFQGVREVGQICSEKSGEGGWWRTMEGLNLIKIYL